VHGSEPFGQLSESQHPRKAGDEGTSQAGPRQSDGAAKHRQIRRHEDEILARKPHQQPESRRPEENKRLAKQGPQEHHQLPEDEHVHRPLQHVEFEKCRDESLQE